MVARPIAKRERDGRSLRRTDNWLIEPASAAPMGMGGRTSTSRSLLLVVQRISQLDDPPLFPNAGFNQKSRARSWATLPVLLRSGSQLGRCRDSRVDLARRLQFVRVRAWGPSLRLWSSPREGGALRPPGRKRFPLLVPVRHRRQVLGRMPPRCGVQGLSRAGGVPRLGQHLLEGEDEPLASDRSRWCLACHRRRDRACLTGRACRRGYPAVRARPGCPSR